MTVSCCLSSLLSSVSNKDILFIFAANKVAAEEVPLCVPLEQKVVKDVQRLNSSILPSQPVAIKLSPVRKLYWCVDRYMRKTEPEVVACYSIALSVTFLSTYLFIYGL